MIVVILKGYNSGLVISILSNTTQLAQEEVAQILRNHGKMM